ncbi:MAG: hypothetical protein ACFFA0_10965 [Promethearchaeota archaeon]
MERKGNPKFSEFHRHHFPFPWPPWDPLPDFLQILDEKAIREVAKLQVNYRIKEMKMHIEFMEEMEKLI